MEKWKEKAGTDLVDRDDWLQKEKIRESKISAWDFDEGKLVRYEHAENCDARENAQEQHIMHIRTEMPRNARKTNASPWLFFDLAILVTFFPLFGLMADSGLGFLMIAPVVLFAGLFFGLFFYAAARRSLPSNGYFIFLFILFVILTAAGLLLSSSGFRYLIWRLTK